MSKCYDNPEYDKSDNNLQNTWKQSKYIEPKQDLEKEMFQLEQELDIPSSMRWHNSKPKQVKYTEDEVRELLIKGLTHNDDKLCGSLVTVQKEIRTANFNVWFEENKKK